MRGRSVLWNVYPLIDSAKIKHRSTKLLIDNTFNSTIRAQHGLLMRLVSMVQRAIKVARIMEIWNDRLYDKIKR